LPELSGTTALFEIRPTATVIASGAVERGYDEASV
jgi:hypothetical protein